MYVAGIPGIFCYLRTFMWLADRGSIVGQGSIVGHGVYCWLEVEVPIRNIDRKIKDTAQIQNASRLDKKALGLMHVRVSR